MENAERTGHTGTDEWNVFHNVPAKSRNPGASISGKNRGSRLPRGVIRPLAPPSEAPLPGPHWHAAAAPPPAMHGESRVRRDAPEAGAEEPAPLPSHL